MKTISFIALALSGAVLFGCNQATNHEHHPSGKDTLAQSSQGPDHAGSHVYSCPMHPEVTSNSAGKCSKCGMALVHTDQAANSKKYRMEFLAKPAQIEAGKSAALSFTPKEESNAQAPVPLDVVHEKKIHLILVSKDLSYFSHEHPAYQAAGDYVWEHTFPSGGEYLLFQDFTPKGAAHQLSRIPVQVAGQPKAAVKYTAQNLDWKKDGYEVKLGFDKTPLQTNQATEVKITVAKDGKSVTNLDNYLGALGHMVIISADTEDYLHVHPLESQTQGPDIVFHSSFDKPGFYRVFLQFNHEGKIQTADFTIQVQSAPSNT
ncbi:MAG: hypothetical protein H7Z75_15010 [Ferruginibacter sp.]|nr:hypothetical protein [Cytophagales bacterium]